MLDGAPTMGDERLAHVMWRTPAEVFEIKLRAMIADILKPMKMFSVLDESVAANKHWKPFSDEQRRKMSEAAQRRERLKQLK